MRTKPLQRSILTLIVFVGSAAHAQDCMWKSIPAPGPSDRFHQAIAYDSARARIILFGGTTFPIRFGDTWEWDGSAWSLRSTSGPSPRYLAALAYDSVRARTVLLGGAAGGPATYANDTWEWDGSTWTQHANAPSSNSARTMIFDSIRNRCVAVGGSPTGTTYEWDGSAWITNPTPGPPPASGQTMVFDAVRGRSILICGTGHVAAAIRIFEYDGATWTERPSINAPPARSNAAATFDPIRSKVVLVGGIDPVQGPVTDTWEWDPASGLWARRALGQPWRRYTPSFTWDSTRGIGIMMGSSALASGLNVWEYRGAGNTEFMIEQPPQSQSIEIFAPFSFTVSAPGATSYQWYRGITRLSDGGFISGATTPTLSVSYSTFGSDGPYHVEAQGPCGPAFATAFLTVRPGGCYANCDGSTGVPALSAGDFQCFIDHYAAGDAYANCDGSTGFPTLTANDFQCFMNSWAQCQ